MEVKSENEVSEGENIENVSNFLAGNMVKCSECKKELPKSHEAIKHHMITEHMPIFLSAEKDINNETEIG